MSRWPLPARRTSPHRKALELFAGLAESGDGAMGTQALVKAYERLGGSSTES